MKPNAEIRTTIDNSCFFTWQIAERIGIHENTFYRWMRKELPGDKKEMINTAIALIKEEMEQAGL